MNPIIRMASAAAFSAALLMLPTAAKADSVPVTVAQSSNSMNFIPVYIANQRGYFGDEGLKPEISLAGGGTKAMTATLSGSVDIGISVLTDVIKAHRRGQKNVKVVGVLLRGYPSGITLSTKAAAEAGVTADSTLADRVRALKGKKVGITAPGAFSDTLVRTLASTHGLDPDRDMDIVPIGGFDNMLAAFRTGQVDACACVPPADVMLVNEKVGIPLVDPMKDLDASEIPTAVVYAMADTIEKKRDVVVGFVRALARAEALLAENPDDAAAATQVELAQLDSGTFQSVWPIFSKLVPASPEITAHGLELELAFQKVTEPNAQDVPFDQIADLSVIKEATSAKPN